MCTSEMLLGKMMHMRRATVTQSHMSVPHHYKIQHGANKKSRLHDGKQEK